LAALMGIPPLVSGMLQVFAGIKNLWFRGRVLGIVALVSNVGTLITCYCAPTAIALMIFGLIVYLNQQVAEAFRMGQAGATRGEVLLAFTPYYGPAPPK
jgi:hypothetical protein